MDQIISIVNHKGGVGKTTSAVNIAACCGEAGNKVLLIDLDPQGSATLHLGIRDDGAALLNALQKTVALPVVPTATPSVDLVPSGPQLSAARQRFAGVIGTELLSRCVRQTQGDWSITIIDCPPSIEILTINALKTSNAVLIPVETNYLALNGLDQMLDTIASIKRDNPGISLLALIPCRMHPRRRLHNEIMEQLGKRFPGKVAPGIRENVSLAEATGKGKPVVLTAPSSHGAEDYRNTTRWLFPRLA